MSIDFTFVLLVAATIVTGLLAGASLDKLLVQLPARHRIGPIAFAAFSRANDLGNGLILYPLLGIGAALLTLLAALAAALSGVSLTSALPLYLSAVLAVLHTFTTTRAAPNMLSLRQSGDDEAKLTATFDRFAQWHTIRTILLVLNFVSLVWALATSH